MDYIRTQVAVRNSPEFLDASPSQRGTWYCLLSYCAEQENHGLIDDCQTWTDRHWLQSCGATLAELQDQCDLWMIEVTDGRMSVQVAFYPSVDQEKCEALRKRAKVAGLRSAQSKKQSKPNGQPNGTPKGQPDAATEERIGKDSVGDQTDDADAHPDFTKQTTPAKPIPEFDVNVWATGKRKIKKGFEWRDTKGDYQILGEQHGTEAMDRAYDRAVKKIELINGYGSEIKLRWIQAQDLEEHLKPRGEAPAAERLITDEKLAEWERKHAHKKQEPVASKSWDEWADGIDDA